MTDNDAAAARARGQALRSARLARARTIRRRIVAGSLALFVAAWLLIAVVLASGHDPALAKKAATTSSATTVASTPTSSDTSTGTSSDTSTATSSNTSTDASSNTSSATSSGTSSGGTVSSVTTSQS